MTGKNSITGNPKYKMPGRIAIGMPYKSIGDQIASDAWNNKQTEGNSQLFVNSTIEKTLNSFKSSNEESIKLNYSKTLNGFQIPENKNLTLQTTYNQILNISHEDMATFDYVVIDECHTLSDGLSYRAEVIARLMNYLIEFVAKKRKSKTKIIFMTGTPNVETLVIPELMEKQSIKDLFQIIKIDKEYKKTPVMYLTHLDTVDVKIRKDTVITEIKKYLKKGRKVVQIFNNKEKMDEYRRELQTKISADIKIGLFYSGSEGHCTENILSGKFGDYDIVLATIYFINGININLDNITNEEHSNGGTSTQQYAVIIDLGNIHTKVSALDAIQTINRFRNRLCYSTVFLPKIFKPNLNDTSKKFDLRNTGKVLLGINRYNHHLLSANKDRTAILFEEATQKQKIHYLDEIRKSPSEITKEMIEKRMKQSKDETTVINSIDKQKSIYEDWFYSMDGYHYMAEDAGIASIIKHIHVSEPLKDISKEHLDLENKVIQNFLDDDKALFYLEGQLEPDKRILVKASGTIKDPLSNEVSNFIVDKYKNDKYEIQGDFHTSHERALNKLIRYHLKLSYYYGADEAIEILRFLIREDTNFAPFKTPSYLKSIANYVNSFSYLTNDKYLKQINYLRALDYLSQKNIGIIKEVFSTYISFTFINDKVVASLKEMWAKQQFDKTKNGIENNKLIQSTTSKDELKEEFSDEELIKEVDLEDLEDLLNKLTIYSPMKKDKTGEVKSHERIIIPRILRSDKFLSEMKFLECDSVTPEYSDQRDSDIEFKNFTDKILKRLDDHMTPTIRMNHVNLENVYNSLKVKLKKRDVQVTSEYIEGILNDPKKNKIPELSRILNALKKDLKELDRFLLSAFKTAEYLTYKNINDLKIMPFIEQTFFCDKDFKLESLLNKFSTGLINFNITDIYDSLSKESDKYIKKDKIKIRTKTGREVIDFNNSTPSNITTTAHIISDIKGNIMYANFDQLATCKFLCDYAFKNERFKMIDGSIPVKNLNKGIYNPNTFKKDYFTSSSESRSLSNYIITTHDLNIKEYGSYVKTSEFKKAI
ncbi:DEAD/DEAH box helicase family protein [Polaribacter sargassicola]|uniref:DEAD/DEAH box helicase family protein n=1 Tax=Polaribacter sargassicola TaxID=2836891 RepID=UPI001F21819D|nr:DEAD/DEAH box helicase family protein [Polaribacter sp. DS7-9]MCG1034841.1 DEAD/DEAH box helicase family protein [Polaribacter sp. DS7-9]